MATPEQSKHEKRNHTIELIGIPDELLKLLDKRVSQSGSDRSGYILELLRKELLEIPNPEMTYEQLLDPVHRQVRESGMTEEDIEDLFEDARKEVWQEYQNKSNSL